jgi:hypothetical protein
MNYQGESASYQGVESTSYQGGYNQQGKKLCLCTL